MGSQSEIKFFFIINLRMNPMKKTYTKIRHLVMKNPINPWSVLTFLFCFLLVGPFGALFVLAFGVDGELWSHLFETVFPRYVKNTLFLMAGVGILSLFFGITTAWIVARLKFPGVKVLEWCLILPATIPAYIIAYTYTDFLEYAGPVQVLLREVFDWNSSQDYWFPEIRSMGGAIFVMATVLYPYIYLFARTAFRMTPRTYYETALFYNRSFPILVDLPLARPAIVAGLALVLMEVISDFGTVEYFAIETLTLGIFNVWLGMNNLTGAAQIALIAFFLIICLLYVEKSARSKQRFHAPVKAGLDIAPKKIKLLSAVICSIFCLFPIICGFFLPVTILLDFVLNSQSLPSAIEVLDSAFNSLLLSSSAAVGVVIVATITVFTITYKNHPFLSAVSSIAATGYAFPGVVLAIGIISFSSFLEGGAAWASDQLLGFKTSTFLIGGVGLLIFGYIVRFQAIGFGAMNSGVKRVSPNIMNASFVLGLNFSGTMIRLGPPLFYKSMLTAGLLVFVDVMKELPLTLILRPFNFETLSTSVYQLAKDELLEQAAPESLMIVIAGLLPIWLINSTQRD